MFGCVCSVSIHTAKLNKSCMATSLIPRPFSHVGRGLGTRQAQLHTDFSLSYAVRSLERSIISVFLEIFSV